MSTDPVNSEPHAHTPVDRPRRALIVVDAAAATLQRYLAAYGYETLTTTTDAAQRAIGEFVPDIAIIELHRGGISGEDASIALARRLRAEPATYSLPLVFVWSQDGRGVRSAALYIGADDYFSLATPPAEVMARLDALFWRMEADRRSAPVAGDQRLEIDNFMLLLDSVRDEIRIGASGALALINAVERNEGQALDKAARDHTLAQAHSFFKLNLRRVDAVAFYGPTTLLVYLPRMRASAALDSLSKLRDQFLTEYDDSDVAIGLASFPEDGNDVESMVEKAEAAADYARTSGAPERVVAYEAVPQSDAPRQSRTQHQMETQTKTSPVEAEPLVLREAETDSSQPHAVQDVGQPSSAGDDLEAAKATAHLPLEQSRAQPNGADAARNASAAVRSASETAARSASEAAAMERERRAGGAIMPRRLLLTVSNAARMAQLNSLIRSAGYEARAAFDGQQALDLLRIERPDLLLLDYELQGIDGVETLRRLRKQGGGKLTLPVIMLLPPENERAEREALELGAHSVIRMPYDPANLLASVRVAGHAE